MNLFLMLLITVVIPTWYIYPSRIISMTYRSSAKSITIKNRKLAELLIAEENTWGIATDIEKKNKMSLWGVISYFIFHISPTNRLFALQLVGLFQNRQGTVVRDRAELFMDSDAVLCDCISHKTERGN